MANSINDLDSSSRGREWQLDRADINVMPGLNIRTDYGDLDDLASVVDGIKQPLIGFMCDGNFLVCDGHRRLTKYDELGCTYKIPCKLDQSCSTRKGQVLLALGMASAKSLTMLERASGYKLLLDDGMTLEQIAAESFKTATSIRDCLQLLEAPTAVQELIQSAAISPTEALEVMRADGDNAGAVIEKAVEIAKTMGKTKATARHTQLAREEDGVDRLEPELDTSYVDDMISFLENCDNFDGVDWSKFAPSVLKKLVAQLTIK